MTHFSGNYDPDVIEKMDWLHFIVVDSNTEGVYEEACLLL